MTTNHKLPPAFEQTTDAEKWGGVLFRGGSSRVRLSCDRIGRLWSDCIVWPLPSFQAWLFGLPGHSELPTSIPETLQAESVYVAGDPDKETTNALRPQGG